MLSALKHLIAGLAALVFGTLFFRPPVAMLPKSVRLSSPGFLFLVAAFFAASYVRHVVVAEVSVGMLLISNVMYAALVVYIAGGERLNRAAMFFSASVGIDLLAALLGSAGFVELRQGDVRMGLLTWELLAGTWGCIALTLADKRASKLGGSDA